MKKSGSGKYESYWIYIPKKLAMDISFPFTDKEEVMVEITENGLNIKKSSLLHDLIRATRIKSATLPKLIEQKALENKDKPFVYYKNEQISYHQTNASSNRFSHGVLALINKLKLRRSTIALIWPNNPEYLFLWFGIVKSGSIFVPINTEDSSETLKFKLNSSKTDIVILDYRYFKNFSEIRDQLPNLKKVIIQNAPKEFEFNDFFINIKEIDTSNTLNPDVVVKDVHKMQINFTSGTTGKPKGIMYRNVFVFTGFNIGKEWKDFGYKEYHTVHCPAPLYHGIHQMLTILPALFFNASVLITESFNPISFWDDMKKYNVSGIFYFRSFILDLINQTPEAKDRNHPVKWAYGLGATKDTWQTFENRFGVTLYEGWTLSEGNGIMINKSGTKEGKVGSIGKPLPGYEIKIVDEKGNQLPPGPDNIGEIITRSSIPPMLEYIKSTISTESQEKCMFKEGWNYTKDYGYKDKDDFVYFVGREADKIHNSNGDFYAYEIENVARTHPFILDCAVFAIPNESNENDDIKLCVVVKKDASLKHEELYNYLIQSLAYYKIPRYFELVKDLPKSSTTQIKKFILKERWDSQESRNNTWDLHLKDFINN